jgi:phenylacetate-CoA ligase
MSFLRRQAINLYEWVDGRHIMARLAELNRIQWLSREEVLAYQQDKLYRLLKYAYTFIPYYRRSFDQIGLQPDDILTDPAAFQKIPTISKTVIRDNFDDLVTTDPSRQRGLARNTTGGSTGQPLIFIQDLVFRDYVMAGVHFHLQYTGWQFGECHAYIWGTNYEVATQKALRTRLLDWSLNRFVTNAYALSEESMAAFVQKIRQRHPKLLVGYASALERFAKFVQAHHLDDIKFSGISSTAEVLYPSQRELIERAFGCDVLDRYGARELGGIACECLEHKGLHIGAGEVYVEVLRDGVPVPVGEKGDIVVTNLHNYGMPFIRYRVGDIGQLSDVVCPCGRGLPMMEVLQGRRVDMFKTKDGRAVWGGFLSLMFDMEGVKQFQVVQKSYDKIVIRIVKDAPLDEARLTEIVRTVHIGLGNDVSVEFEYPEEIAVERSGKYRYAISEVHDT